MKIGNSAENILVTNVDASNRGKFGIQATGKAFWILSNALYQHKVRAVVREVGCNAYDAHIAAGTTSTPFTVSLPSVTDPHFRVRDFGIGLAPEKFIEIYTTYFGSTKSESNDETGGLGLGSKTPFIMSKSFTVHSFYNGVDYMWHSFVNDNGEPDVMLLNEKPTTEPNGLLVIVPVGHGISDTERNALFREFVTEAKNIYQWFDVLPTVTQDDEPVEIISRLRDANSVYTSLPITGVGRSTRVFYHNDQPGTSQSNSILVKMGNVVYPYNVSETRNLDRFGGNIIHTEALLQYITRNGRMNPVDHQLVIEVAMGDVDFAPSREALSLNNATELTIINSIVRFMTLFAQHIQKEIDAATDTFTKYHLLYQVVPIPNAKFQIDGKDVSPHDHRPSWAFVNPGDEAAYQDKVLRMFDATKYGVRYRREGTRGITKYERSFEEHMYGKKMRNRTVILIDQAYKGELRLWVNANVSPGDAVVILAKPDGRSPLTADDMAPFLEDRHPQVKRLSQLKAPVIAPRAQQSVKKVTTETALRLVYTGTRYSYFTQGNGIEIKVADILEFDEDAPTIYVAFQKKGNTISSTANIEDTSGNFAPGLHEFGTWSRATGRYSSNWSAAEAYELLTNHPTDMHNAGFQLLYTPDGGASVFDIDMSPQTVKQIVMTKDAYDEFVDKPEYPHIMSVHGWVEKVLIPSMPKQVTSTAVRDTTDQFSSHEAGDGFKALLDVLGLNAVDVFQNDIYGKSTDHSASVRRMVTLLAGWGYAVDDAEYNITTYDFSNKEFGDACLAAVAAGILPQVVYQWMSYMTVNFASVNNCYNTLTYGYYRASRDSQQALEKTVAFLLDNTGYKDSDFAAFLIKHYEDNKKIS